MDRGANSPVQSMFVGHKVLIGAVLGGGAASNGTLPSNGQLTDTLSTYAKGANFATSLTYVSTGIYDFKYSQQVKHLLFADGIVVKAGASPTTALACVVTIITPGTRTVRVRIVTPAGVLTDLGTNDLLILRMDVGDTSSIG